MSYHNRHCTYITMSSPTFRFKFHFVLTEIVTFLKVFGVGKNPSIVTNRDIRGQGGSKKHTYWMGPVNSTQI